MPDARNLNEFHYLTNDLSTSTASILRSDTAQIEREKAELGLENRIS